MNPAAAKILRASGILLCIAVFAALLADRYIIDVPMTRRVGEFTGGDLTLQLTPEFHSPYHFVVATPVGTLAPPSFSGSIEIRDGEHSVATVQISSATVEPCNWLDEASGLNGYILDWNAPQQISAVLHHGTPYTIRISLLQALPAGCSLWFASMRHVSSVFGRDV
jgi:hypothetical protein